MGASLLLTSLGLVAETRQIITWDTTEISQLLSPDKDFAKAILLLKIMDYTLCASSEQHLNRMRSNLF